MLKDKNKLENIHLLKGHHSSLVNYWNCSWLLFCLFVFGRSVQPV